MSSPVEDGELPEEGEIMEEEEEETVASTASGLAAVSTTSSVQAASSKKIEAIHSKKTFALVCTGATTPSLKTSKYRDYDGKTARRNETTQETIINSWMTGFQRGRPTLSLSAVQAHSPNSTITMGQNSESEILPKVEDLKENDADEQVLKKEAADRDFRRLSLAEEGGEILDEKEDGEADDGEGLESGHLFGGEEEDNDFRQTNGYVDRRRRHVEEEFAPSTKRVKVAVNNPFTASPLSESRENSPTSFHEVIGERRGFMNTSGRTVPPHWAARTICKFFREGYCRDIENCPFSHNAADSNRRSELCKFYAQGYCKRGMNCTHLHGEYPCKTFHKGECTEEQCRFSHRPLDDFTQPIFDQMLQDEELTSNISLPSQPQKRKVLLPQGPENYENSDQAVSPTSGKEVLSTPSTTTSSRLTQSSSIQFNQQHLQRAAAEEKVMAASGIFGFFNPITSTTGKPGHVTSHHQNTPTIPPAQTPTSMPSEGNMIPPPVLTPNSAQSIGAFSTLPPPLPSSTLAGSRSRLSLQKPQTHGFYNSPVSRVANMPPPALLTAPPPLASNPNASTSTYTTIATPSTSLSPTSFFNPPVIAPSTSNGLTAPTISSRFATNSSHPLSTTAAPLVASPLSGLFSTSVVTPSVSKSDETTADVVTTNSQQSAKPLSGIFSGGFFENTSTNSSLCQNTSNDGSGGMTMGGGDGGGFNISMMLEKITQQAAATPTTATGAAAMPSFSSIIEAANSSNKQLSGSWEEESPASPTNPFADAPPPKMIPVIREWKLYMVDVDKDDVDGITVDMKWIGQISSGSYRNDPRLKKLAEKQFDLVTKTLEKQSGAGGLVPTTSSGRATGTIPLSNLAGNDVSFSMIKQELADSTTTSGASPPKKSSILGDSTRPTDPRMKLTDPRKRSTQKITPTAVLPQAVIKKEPNCYLDNSNKLNNMSGDGMGSFSAFEDIKPTFSNAIKSFTPLSTVAIEPYSGTGIATAASCSTSANPGTNCSAAQKQPFSDDIFQSMIQQQLKMVNQMQQKSQSPEADLTASGTSFGDDVDHRATLQTPLFPPRVGKLADLSPPYSNSNGGCSSSASAAGYAIVPTTIKNSNVNNRNNAMNFCGAVIDPRPGGVTPTLAAVTAPMMANNSGNNSSNNSADSCPNDDNSNGGSGFGSAGFGSGFSDETGQVDEFEDESYGFNNSYNYKNQQQRQYQRFNNGRGFNNNNNRRYSNAKNNSGQQQQNQAYHHHNHGVGGRNFQKKSNQYNNYENVAIASVTNAAPENNAQKQASSPVTAASQPPQTQQQQPAQQQQPLSLREKRKNNEYESPLARMTTKY